MYEIFMGKSGRINPTYIKANPELVKQLMHEYPFTLTVKEALFCFKNDIHKTPLCKMCNNKVTFGFLSKGNYGYQTYCTKECVNKDTSLSIKRQTTCLEKYGVANPTAFGTDKHNQVMVEKYGTTNVMKIPEVVQKIVNTNIERYGNKNLFGSDYGIQKIKDTNIKRYGVSSSMQRDEIKTKYRDINGNWSTTKNTEQRKLSKLNYTIEQVSNRLNSNGFDLLTENIQSFNYKYLHSIQCKCGYIFKQTLGYGKIPRCFKCNPKLVGTSKLQIKLEQELQKYTTIEINKRLLNGKEIDIYLPEFKIGIEVNGLYWHSELMGKSKKYHQEKTELAASLDITLIHLYEDTLINKFDIVLSMLKAKMGISTRIFARKCKLIVVSAIDAKNFCEMNHLQGSTNISTAIGLTYNNELIALGTFGKPRFNKDYEVELLRFCTKQGITIIGGFTKILNRFIMMYKPKNILSYADRSYSNGNVYIKAGFKLVVIRNPGYYYFRNNENIRYHRSLFQKHKLSKKLESFNPKLSEWENMKNHGWNRIWDSGQLVFGLILN